MVMVTVTKETMKQVPKVWGSELWLVNEPEYCGKLLFLDKGATCSYHRHPVKKETFYALVGQVALTVDGRNYMLNPFSRPKTIQPGQLHQFHGITDAVIMEVSTHHEDTDVERISESVAGIKEEGSNNGQGNYANGRQGEGRDTEAVCGNGEGTGGIESLLARLCRGDGAGR